MRLRTIFYLSLALLSTIALGAAGRSGGHDSLSRTRPLPPGFTEGYGNDKVLAFQYPQQWYCNDELGDDLDGPGHRGDGVPVERDPDEHQHPGMGPPGSPCIVGDTGSGSLPRQDPTGTPVENAEPIWAILPFFDSEDPDPVIDAVDPTTDDNVDHQCPEPGPPFTQHRGEFGTCTMHPSTLHAEPVVALGAGDIVLPNHSQHHRRRQLQSDLVADDRGPRPRPLHLAGLRRALPGEPARGSALPDLARLLAPGAGQRSGDRRRGVERLALLRRPAARARSDARPLRLVPRRSRCLRGAGAPHVHAVALCG